MINNLNTPESTYQEPEYKNKGLYNMANLIRTMLNDYGVFHVQFNTVDKKLLEDAYDNPEKYPTLS